MKVRGQRVSVHENPRSGIAEVIDVLSTNEQTQLSRLSEKLLARLTRDRASGDFICRFCEIESCPQDRCPVAARALKLLEKVCTTPAQSPHNSSH
jgi:hypothetical protein